MSYADQVFHETITKILEEGISDAGMQVRPRWEDGTPAHTKAILGVVNRYDLKKEFPILTLRRTYWKSAWDEIAWIYQKKSNNVHDLSSHVWDAWADENGSIGKAYGYQAGKKYRCKDVSEDGVMKAFADLNVIERITDGKQVRYYAPVSAAEAVGMDDAALEKASHAIFCDGVFLLDQMDKVIYDLVNNPASRRIMTNLYQFQDLSEMALAPCAYSMTFNVVQDEKTGKKTLSGILNQRSQDMIAANNWNCVQYALIIYALSSAYGFEPGELVHVIANCHLYDRHEQIAKDLMNKEQFPAPKLEIDDSIKDFYKFTKNSFKLTDYRYNEFHDKIEVAI